MVRGSIYTLSDGNSVVQIDGASQTGLFNWSVDGQNQASQQWFWYRVGSSGGESSINTIGAATAVQSDASHLSLTYTASQFSIQIVYSLLGGSGGSGASDLSEQVNISNPSHLDFHFFQYSDLDLGGTAGGDSIQLGTNLSGMFNEAFQSEAGTTLAETVTSPGANHASAAFFNSTLTLLNDGNPTTLNGNAGPLGPGDVTWAFEWDSTQTSILVSKDLNISGVVPEPSTLSLLSSAIVAFGLWRNRRK